MKYYRTWKEADAKREEVTYEEAYNSMSTTYRLECIDDMLAQKNQYPTMFAFIEVEEGPQI